MGCTFAGCAAMARAALLLWLLICASSPAKAQLRLLVSGDLHGWIASKASFPRQSAYGLAYLESALTEARQQGPSLYLDTGDAQYGSPSSQYLGRQNRSFAARLSGLGLDAIVPGEEDLLALASPLPWVAANLEGAPQVPPFRVFERAGLKIAVLGLVHPASGIWVDLPTGMTLQAPLETAKVWVPRIRAQEKPDLLILLYHQGARNEKDREAAIWADQQPAVGAETLAAAVPGIDLILTGHDHWQYPRSGPLRKVRETALAGPGSRGRKLLLLDFQAGSWQPRWLRARETKDPKLPEGFKDWVQQRLPVHLKYSGKDRQSRCFEALAAAGLRSPGRFGSALPLVYLRQALKPGPLSRADLYQIFRHDDRPQDVLLSQRDLALLASPEAPAGRRQAPYSHQVHLDLSEPLELTLDWLWPDSGQTEPKYLIAMSGYHLRGAGGIFPRLFNDQVAGPSGAPLRESVFAYLDARRPLPPACDFLSYLE
ncbi:MAG: metallophosphoesterase [bacterium]|nr:metallophosphoesterase [bacterium]